MKRTWVLAGFVGLLTAGAAPAQLRCPEFVEVAGRHQRPKRGGAKGAVGYQEGRGRVVANEYANRGYLVVDSLRLRRTDGALVRVISPVLSTADQASGSALSFVQAMFPHLTQAIP